MFWMIIYWEHLFDISHYWAVYCGSAGVLHRIEAGMLRPPSAIFAPE
jgi:hypothetical protein